MVFIKIFHIEISKTYLATIIIGSVVEDKFEVGN